MSQLSLPLRERPTPKSHSRQPYSYEPLPSKTHIRVLRRLGKTDDGLPEFSFKTIDTEFDWKDPKYMRGLEPSDQPYYHCLSYTWGNPLPDGDPFYDAFAAAEDEYSETALLPIVCDGMILNIRRNLYEFLTSLAAPNFSTVMKRRISDRGQTLLHLHSLRGHTRLLFDLIGSGPECDLNAVDGLGQTALHLAASEGHFDCVRILLKAGASPSMLDSDLRSPQDLADLNGHSEVVALLDEYSTNGPGDLLGDISEFAASNPDDNVWIDAICINQGDLKERASQVAIMNTIYTRAMYVVVWLGKEDQYIDSALSALSKLTTNVEGFVNSKILSFDSDQTLESHFDSAGVPRISQEEWDGLAALLLRQWFSRIWVVQETVLARHILMYCGEKQIEWTQVEDAVAAIQQHDVTKFSGLAHGRPFLDRYRTRTRDGNSRYGYFEFNSITLLKHFYTKVKQVESENPNVDRDDPRVDYLYDYFSTFSLTTLLSRFQATDPRDMCYALLPMRSLYCKSDFVPDYAAPIPLVYINFAREMMRTEKNPLDILFLEALEDLHLGPDRWDLPSWVPSFHKRLISNRLYHSPFRASLHPSRPPFLILNAAEFGLGMRVSSLRCDTVGWVVEEAGGPTEWLAMISELRNPFGHYHGTGQSFAEALWRTLCGDCSETTYMSHILEANREHGKLFKYYLLLRLRLRLDVHRAADGSGSPPSPSTTDDSDLLLEEQLSQSSYFSPIKHLLPVIQDLYDNGGQDCIPSLAELRDFANGTLIPDEHESVEAATSAIIQGADVYAHSQKRACLTMKLCMTLGGYLALAPISAREGDEVWIIDGLKAPFILRYVSAAGKEAATKYLEVVGPAYVHGMMFGEAVAQGTIDNEFEMIALI